MVESTGAAKGGSRSCLIGIIVAVSAIGILALLMMPTITSTTELADRASCKNNLKQIGTACHIWATAHRQCWPRMWSEDSSAWYEVGNTRTDRWDELEQDGEPPDVTPGDKSGPPPEPIQSNTASLWLMVVAAGLTQDVFLCPSADCRHERAAMNYAKVRDFRGEKFCSYSYQNMLGPYLLKEAPAYASQLAVAADANPMRRDYWSGGPGGGMPIGITNRKLAERPKFEECEETPPWNQQAKCIRRAWELNSPNHQFKGQNVLYLDGHAEWREHPYVGVNWDNIWLRRRTDVTAPIDPKNLATIRAYNDESSYDGRSTLPEGSTGDSFLVP